MLELLRERAENGGAVLMSTHTLAAVERVADTVSVIDHGKMLFNGATSDLHREEDLEQWFLDLTEDQEQLTAPSIGS